MEQRPESPPPGPEVGADESGDLETTDNELDAVDDEAEREPEQAVEKRDDEEGPSAFGDELVSRMATVDESIGRLWRLAELREQRFSKLHRELDEHRKGHLERSHDPYFLGLIRLRDDFARRLEIWRAKSPDQLSPERLLNLLDGCVDDVDLLLEQYGVSAFEEPSDQFSPGRQTAARTVPCDDKRAGTLAARLRPGFEVGERLLIKERVAVFARKSMESPRSEVSDE